MAGRENKKIKQIFPPILRKNLFFSIKNTNNEYAQQGCEKGRVKKTSVAKEMICRYVPKAVADDVGIRKA